MNRFVLNVFLLRFEEPQRRELAKRIQQRDRIPGVDLVQQYYDRPTHTNPLQGYRKLVGEQPRGFALPAILGPGLHPKHLPVAEDEIESFKLCSGVRISILI